MRGPAGCLVALGTNKIAFRSLAVVSCACARHTRTCTLRAHTPPHSMCFGTARGAGCNAGRVRACVSVCVIICVLVCVLRCVVIHIALVS